MTSKTTIATLAIALLCLTEFQTTRAQQILESCSVVGALDNSRICGRYRHCTNLGWLERDCALGTRFDKRINATACVHASLVTECEEMETTCAPHPHCAGTKRDLVVILDASGSVGYDDFQLMKAFTKDILVEAEIDNGNVRVGIVVYNFGVRVEFHLNAYQTKADVYNAIDGIRYTGGGTNTAGALKTTREEMFLESNGDRLDGDNIAFLITDGLSNVNEHSTIPEARQTRAENIRIFAFGIGRAIIREPQELEAIASRPVEENSFIARRFSDLSKLGDTIFSRLCMTTTPKPTTTFPVVGEPCSTVGQLENSRICGSYFHCTNTGWEERQCAPGTRYDKNILATSCVHQLQVTNCQEPCVNGKRDNSDVDGQYLLCQDGVWVPKICPPGTRFNKALDPEQCLEKC